MDARNAGQNNGGGRANCLDPKQVKAKKEGGKQAKNEESALKAKAVAGAGDFPTPEDAAQRREWWADIAWG